MSNYIYLLADSIYLHTPKWGKTPLGLWGKTPTKGASCPSIIVTEKAPGPITS